MIKKYFSLLIIFCYSFATAQNQRSIDSCLSILKTTKVDTLKMSALSKLATLTIETQTSFPDYDKQLILLCNKVLSNKPNNAITKSCLYYLGIGFERYSM